LEVIEVRITYLTWYRDKGNPRKRSANHAKGNQKPMGIAVSCKESISGQLSGSQPGNKKKYSEINEYNG
jgi:hypothetical protein